MLVPQGGGLLLSVLNYLIEAGVGGDGVRIEPQFFILFSELGVDLILLSFFPRLTFDSSLMLKMIVFLGIQFWMVVETCKTGK